MLGLHAVVWTAPVLVHGWTWCFPQQSQRHNQAWPPPDPPVGGFIISSVTQPAWVRA